MNFLSKTLFLIVLIAFGSCEVQAPVSILEMPELRNEASFGQSVAVSSNTLFVGAPGADGVTASSGRVFLYSAVDTGWVKAGELESRYRDPEMHFGASISVDNDRVIVGAPDADRMEKDAGTAMIFERNEEGSWEQTMLLVPDTIIWNARFGSSVAISGDRAIVGAIFGQTNKDVTGAAYIFTRQDDGQWDQTARLRPSSLDQDDRYGSSVALYGNIAIIGAPNDDEKGEDAGAAYVFEKQADGSWKEVTKLASAGRGGRFGYAVAMSGDKIVIGAHWYLTEGTAFVFEKGIDGSWEKSAMLDPDNKSFPSSNNDRFGTDLALAGNRLLVGAPRGANPEGEFTGMAWYFEQNEDKTWTEGEQIIFPGSQEDDYFGGAVALSADRMVIGAQRSSEGRGSAVVVDR